MSDYNPCANQKFLDEYSASKMAALNSMDIRDEARKNLEAHIVRFPSDLDNTSIGKQLRDHGVHVQLYAEIRDSIWKNYQKVKEQKEELQRFLLQMRNEIDEVL